MLDLLIKEQRVSLLGQALIQEHTQHTPLKVFPASLLVVTIQKVAMTSILMGFIRFIHIMCVCSLLDIMLFVYYVQSASILHILPVQK